MSMGWDISKITNSDLLALARKIDKENTEDGFLKDNEISIFCNEGNSNPELTNTILGFYQTNPITTGNNVAETTTNTIPEVPTNEPKDEINTKEKAEIQKTVKKAIAQLAKNESMTSIQEILDSIQKEYIGADYSDTVMDVMTLANYIIATGYKSKADIDKINAEVKPQLNDFQKQLLGDFIKIAKRDVIYQEAAKLINIYDEKTNGKNLNELNYTNLLKEVKSSDVYKNEVTYKKEAFKALENAVKNEIWYNNTELRVAILKSTEKDSRTVEAVQEQVVEQYNKTDKFARKQSKTKGEKAESGIVARHENKEYVKENVLNNISEKDLKDALGWQLFQKIKSGGYLDNHKTSNGYDLILYAVVHLA